MRMLMLEYPEITSSTILAAVQSGRSCQATKMRKYYSKLVGGLSCSNMEQLKLSMLVYVLEQVYKLDMTCFNNTPADSDYSYLRHFINYLTVECADCITVFSGFNSSASTADIIAGGGGITGTDPGEEQEVINETEGDGINEQLNYILLEDGTYITLENETGYHLMENN